MLIIVLLLVVVKFKLIIIMMIIILLFMIIITIMIILIMMITLIVLAIVVKFGLSTEVTLGRGDLGVCRRGGFIHGAHEWFISKRRGVPQGSPQGHRDKH